MKYLADQLRSYGIQPGNADGSYVQKVPLMGVTSEIAAKLRVAGQPHECRNPRRRCFRVCASSPRSW